MQIAWTKHLRDPEKKAKFEECVRNSRETLDRLKEILQEEENGLDRSEIDIRVFDLPNWENRQAFKNGYRAALHIVKKLTDLDQQKQDNK